MKVSLFTLTEQEANDGRTLFLSPAARRPLIRGRGEIDLVCEQCDFAIAAQLKDLSRLHGLAFTCPGCGVYQGSRT